MQGLVKQLKGRYKLEDLEVDRRIILKWVGIQCIKLGRAWPVIGLYAHDNEASGFY
jgi:hypothetical protein